MSSSRPPNDTEHILICGAGFLGSWFARLWAQYARQSGILLPVMVLDHDRVEERNLPSQNYSPRHLNQSKAEATERVIEEYGLLAMGLNSKLGFDVHLDENIVLVVDCFDNLPSRFAAQTLAESEACACVHLAVSPRRYGTIEWDQQWSLDPRKQLLPSEPEVVELPPCELHSFQMLGIAIAARAVRVVADYLISEKKVCWSITETHQTAI